jgi:CO/xanthine dehydrogenase Mo-binding subunit
MACAIPAAIANAVFDATGARLRSVPFIPEKVKAALAGAQPHRG